MSDRVIQFPKKAETPPEKLNLESVRKFCLQSIEDLNRVVGAIDDGILTEDVLEVMLIHTGYDISYSLSDEESLRIDARIEESVEKNNSRDKCVEAFGDLDLFLALESTIVLKSLDEEKEVRLDEANMLLDTLLGKDDKEEEDDILALCGNHDKNLCSELISPSKKPVEKVVKLKNKMDDDWEDAQDALIETLGDLLDEAKNNGLTRLMFIKGNLNETMKLEYGVLGRWVSPYEMQGAVHYLLRKVEDFAEVYEDD